METTKREFELISLSQEDANEPDPDSAWTEVVDGRKIYETHFCEFGFAEETIACFFFEDGTAEVGVGEPLRPYREVYQGNSYKEAFKAFCEKIAELAF